MKSMENLKRMICEEIDEIAEKGTMSPGDLDVINKLVVTKEKLLRIEEIEDELGYSEDGEWTANGSYGRGSSYRSNMYSRNNSYARGGRRYSRDGYSRAADDMKARMMDLVNTGDFTNSQRQSIQRIMDEM